MSWWLAPLVGAILLLIPTAYAGYIGAPYVPVRRPALKKAFDKLTIGPSDVVIDLGAGDGGVLLEATRRGAKAIGYELSPIMWAIAWIRLLRLPRETRRVKWGNFYKQKLPSETTVVFVFLMPNNLPRLVQYLKTQKVPQAKYLMSYTFALPNIPPRDIVQTQTHGTIYIYDWKQISARHEA